MPHVIDTTILTWLIMLGNGVVIVIFAMSIHRLPRCHQFRAWVGIFVMTFVLFGLCASLFLLASHTPTVESQLSQLVLPLATCILIASLYRLSFPPLFLSPASYYTQLPNLFLFLLMAGVLIGTCGLMLLNLFFA